MHKPGNAPQFLALAVADAAATAAVPLANGQDVCGVLAGKATFPATSIVSAKAIPANFQCSIP